MPARLRRIVVATVVLAGLVSAVGAAITMAVGAATAVSAKVARATWPAG